MSETEQEQQQQVPMGEAVSPEDGPSVIVIGNATAAMMINDR
jgi:hypothetical protein